MTTRDETLPPADRRLFWRWMVDVARPYLGWALLALGALAIFLGWYGVSGQALTAKQLPYLVSGGVTGIALVLIGAVLLATNTIRREISRLDGVERKVDDLYALLVAEPAGPDSVVGSGPAEPSRGAAPDASVALVALPDGTTYHRSSCPLVLGKSDLVAVDQSEIAARSLRPCPVCDPGPSATKD